MNQPSPKRILRDYLLSRPAVSALTSHIATSTADEVCIRYTLVPGGRVPSQRPRAVVQHRFVVDCWGADDGNGDDAAALCRTVIVELSDDDLYGVQPNGGTVVDVVVGAEYDNDDTSVSGRQARPCQSFDLLLAVTP